MTQTAPFVDVSSLISAWGITITYRRQNGDDIETTALFGPETLSTESRADGQYRIRDGQVTLAASAVGVPSTLDTIIGPDGTEWTIEHESFDPTSGGYTLNIHSAGLITRHRRNNNGGGTSPSTPTTAILTESGDFLTTEDGFYLIREVA